MVHIKITKGLDIPIMGAPKELKSLVLSGEASPLVTPPQIGLNLNTFDEIKFKLLVKDGDSVKIGQPLVEDKSCPGRMFASPAGGTVKAIIRGLKRSLKSIVIDVAKQEQYEEFPPFNLNTASRENLIEHLKGAGLFTRIRVRPFNLLANPDKVPRNIFVKALESAPFVPPAELQVQGYEKEFQQGLNALAKLTSGSVHLVYQHNTPCKAFKDASNVQHHTAEGPHPVSNPSLHIQQIDPIRGSDDNVWVLNVHQVVAIGYLLLHNRYLINRIISIAGPAILSDRVGYFKGREGIPIGALIAGRIEKGTIRFISGEPLTGKKVEVDEFLGYDDFTFTAIKENFSRETLHFFRLGTNKYSFSKGYVSGHLNPEGREYNFTTNQHGEHRPFMVSLIYDEVQPLHVPTVLLVKAVMAEDFDLAESLGLLEVAEEDFGLPAFVCPSKMEMVSIIRNGLKQYSREVLQ